MSVCKVTFGAEPKDYEVYAFVLKNYGRLKFSPAVEHEVKKTSHDPKRIQREAQGQVIPVLVPLVKKDRSFLYNSNIGNSKKEG